MRGLATGAKELKEKLSNREKADAAAKATSKGRGKKGATAANKRTVALKAELADAGAAHARLVHISARSKADANEKRADLKGLKTCFADVEQEAKLAATSLGEA